MLLALLSCPSLILSLFLSLRVRPSDCQSTMALQVLTSRCQGKTSCLVRASTREFGDPCYSGTRKYLSVIYTCGESLCTTVASNSLPLGGGVYPVIRTTTALWINKYLRQTKGHISSTRKEKNI